MAVFPEAERALKLRSTDTLGATFAKRDLRFKCLAPCSRPVAFIIALSIEMAVAEQETARQDSQVYRLPTPDPQSSSPLRQLSSEGLEKPKGKATVTPRTFTRFFTPRSSLGRNREIGASRQILRDITASGFNRKGRPGRGRLVDDRVQSLEEGDDDEFHESSPKRKRYQPISPEPTPDLSSPLKRMRSQSLEILDDEAIDDQSSETSTSATYEDPQEQAHNRIPTWNPIISRRRGPSGAAFSRELGENHRTRRSQYLFNGDIELHLDSVLVADL